MDTQESKKRNKLLLGKITSAMTPEQTVILSFFIIILMGTTLLSLPVSQAESAGHVPVLDCLFTATSAVCVTGLVTVTTATTWTVFGKLVILLLIQIGGLGLVAIIAYLGVHLGKKITLKERLTIQTAFNHTDFHGMVRMVLFVIRGTLICEGIGAAILFFSFLRKNQGVPTSLFYAVFHSISAFCNAGFDIIGDQSLIPFASDIFVNITIALLIIIGGIGFSVWIDLVHNIKNQLSPRTKRRWKFSLHTKLVVTAHVSAFALRNVLFFYRRIQKSGAVGKYGVWRKAAQGLFSIRHPQNRRIYHH